MRRKAKTKRIFLSVFLAIALCLFALAGCQSAGKTPAYGEYLGRDIDECYEAWGITPVEDMPFAGGGVQMRVFPNKQADYLGGKFFVRLTYPITSKSLKFYNEKLDSVTYVRDYYKASDEEVSKDAASFFSAIQEEYRPHGEFIRIDETEDNRGSSIDISALTEEGLREKLKSVRKKIDASRLTYYSIKIKWHLPEEYKKLDPDFVREMEEFDGKERTYCVECMLEYTQGRFVFSVKHSFDILNANGLP